MSIEDFKKPAAYIPALLLLLAGLIPWLAMQHLQIFNQDIAWLVAALQRLNAGGRMTQTAYDTNPPLSMLIYQPALFLAWLTDWSVENAVFASTFCYCLLSAAAIFFLARRLITQPAAGLLALATLLAETLMSFPDFGQRDHLLVVGLLPFILAQYILTARLKISPALLAAIFSLGAIVLLLKPDYGLLPVVMLVHRMIRQRRWRIIGDPDFIALAIATAGIFCMTIFLFSDFATQIFPDVAKLYLPGIDKGVLLQACQLLILYAAIFLLAARGIALPEKNLIRLLLIAAALCLLCYVIEGRSFPYHLLPSLIFFWPAQALYSFALLRRVARPSTAMFVTLGSLLLAGYALHPASSYPTKTQIASLPLTKLVASCGADCRFMLFSVNIRPPQMTSTATGKLMASRFPSLWFIPGLIAQKKAGREHTAAYQALFHKYAVAVAADLAQQKPKLAIACHLGLDYIDFFSADPAFAAAWRAYHKTGSIPVRLDDYYLNANLGQIMQCDVFQRS